MPARQDGLVPSVPRILSDWVNLFIVGFCEWHLLRQKIDYIQSITRRQAVELNYLRFLRQSLGVYCKSIDRASASRLLTLMGY